MSQANRFQTVAKSVQIKQKYSQFMLKNTDESVGIDKIVYLAKKHRILICKDLDQYISGTLNKKRAVINGLVKMSTMITALRFLISAIFNKKWIHILMSDANYLLGDQRLISTIVGSAAFIIFLFGMLIQFQELARTSKLLEFLHGYKYRRIIPLNSLNARRLAIKMNLMAKYLIRQLYWPLVISSSFVMTTTAIMAYFDPSSGFTLISVIFWEILIIQFIVQFSAYVSIGFLVATLSALYLRYKFKEINQNIILSLKLKNKFILMKAITEHNSIAKQTKDLNGFFSYIIFILYFLVSPQLMVLMYLIHAPSTNFYARFIAAFLFILLFIAVFTVNLLSSLISQSAHKPRSLLYTFMIRIKTSSVERLKILAFVEKLSGPDIGFYCWNLFPMNNYKYYQYVANCAATYFLLLDMISKK